MTICATFNFQSVIKACKKYNGDDVIKLGEAINNYGNFQSVCQNKDNLALETFKQVSQNMIKDV